MAGSTPPTDGVAADVGPGPGEVRAELDAWLGVHWDPGLALVAWRDLLVDAGWAVPTWPPRWHGRGLPVWADQVVAEALGAAGAAGLPVGVGAGLVAPTVLAHGPDAVRSRFLRPILTGEEGWCQLFSEPGAGSDLAGLSTTAVLDGGEWVVNGQKVWTTSAHRAHHGLLLARTDWDVPKHRGLTAFALPMAQEGVTVRPLRQMNGHASFNEVFIGDAVIPADHVIGAVGDGWRVGLTMLAFERHFGSIGRPRYPAVAGRAVDEARREAEEHFDAYAWYPQRAGRVDLVGVAARAAGRADDPLVRQEIASVLAAHRASDWTARRGREARAQGGTPGPEGSIGKLALSGVARRAARVHSLVGGADGMLAGPDGAFDGVIAEVLVSVPGQSIAGGTDEIQHNIVGERALGLPREPSIDRDRPFREVRRPG